MQDEAPRVFTGRLELVAATAAGWGAWQVLLVSSAEVIGSLELGAPDGDGGVRCAWQLPATLERKGYAAEAIGGIIDWAFSHPEVRRIRAHAPRSQAAAIRVLEQNGLSHVGDGDEPGTLRFELARP